jgi:DNA-3-methyladenine glycosylase II
MFTLGRLDVLPVMDLGIRKAIMLNYKLKELPDEKKILSIAKRKKWSPYSSIACWYLWQSLEFKD